MNECKEEFKALFKKYVKRDGADKFLEWLETTDFYTAPASTKYHLNHEGGLAEHSIHVYKRLRELYEVECAGEDGLQEYEEEMVAIVGLLHDICKTNYYCAEMRNQKNEKGEWERVPYYTVNDQLPYGHGEKSVYIISGFMRLRRDEAMAIRWHMGFSGPEFRGGDQSVSKAYEMYKLAVIAHIADMEATYLDEVDE